MPSPCTQMSHTFTFLLIPVSSAGCAAWYHDLERRHLGRAGLRRLMLLIVFNGILVLVRLGARDGALAIAFTS